MRISDQTLATLGLAFGGIYGDWYISIGRTNRHSSWNLGAAIIVTIGGRLSDILGRRWFLLFGAIAATIGALVGATGQSINQMITSGIIFGVGGGFQEMCFACAQELVPNKHRFKTLGAADAIQPDSEADGS